jgi:hypothetical protein
MKKARVAAAFAAGARALPFPDGHRSDQSVMMVVMIVVVMVMAGILIPASSLLQRFIKELVDLLQLAHRRADIAGDRRQAVLQQNLLPFLVLGGMFFVMINPVLQQNPYLFSISHVITPNRIEFYQAGYFPAPQPSER